MGELLAARLPMTAEEERAIHGDAIPGTAHTFSGLFDRYITSDLGSFHAGQAPRFSNHYTWDHDKLLADLGDDAHPVHHMSYTEREIVRPLIEHQNSRSDTDVESLDVDGIVATRLAALFHDMGECKHPELKEACGDVVGDVYFFDKTDEHESAEAAIRAHIYSRLYSDVDPRLIVFAEAIIRDPASTLEGRAFWQLNALVTSRLAY